MMNKDTFYDFLITEEGQRVDELIAEANTKLQKQFLPEFFRGSDAQFHASDFIYWLLVDLAAEADEILAAHHFAEQREEILRQAIAKSVQTEKFAD